MAVATATALLAAGGAAATAGAIVSSIKKGDAADARMSAANNALGEARKGAEALQKSAAARPEEIAQLEATIRHKDMVIQREQKLIEAVDPAIMEAGKQAFQLMQGKEAEILGPLQRQRTRDREKLRETLRRQMGPNFEGTAAGGAALDRFDSQTADLTTNAQQGAIGQLLGVSQNAASLGRSTQQGAAGLGLGVAQGYGNIATRETNAAYQGQSLIQNALNNVTAHAGDRDDASANMWSSLGQLGGAAIGAGVGMGQNSGGNFSSMGGGSGGWSLGANTNFASNMSEFRPSHISGSQLVEN